MKKLNCIVAAALAVGMVAGFSSCGGKSAPKSSAGGKIDTSKHVVIQYMTTGNKPTNGATEKMLAKLNAILNEKCNAELQIYYIP